MSILFHIGDIRKSLIQKMDEEDQRAEHALTAKDQRYHRGIREGLWQALQEVDVSLRSTEDSPVEMRPEHIIRSAVKEGR